ncbi:hypothetical protein BDW72DRAFT_180289 [Aspergillus terricola var. indicus]
MSENVKSAQGIIQFRPPFGCASTTTSSRTMATIYSCWLRSRQLLVPLTLLLWNCIYRRYFDRIPSPTDVALPPLLLCTKVVLLLISNCIFNV